MKKMQQKAAIAALTVLIGGGALLPVQSAKAASFDQPLEQVIQQLVSQKVLQGYEDGTLRAEKKITNAELIKMIVLALDLPYTAESQSGKDKWYSSYVNSAVASGLLDNPQSFQPNQPAAGSDAALLIAKALQRDAKSLQYWMSEMSIEGKQLTRGDAAKLLVYSEQAIRSSNAEIVSIKALNKITFEVTFSAPLALEDETTDQANINFAFSEGLKLVNQPRLKTGSVATYVIPVQTMKPGTTYSLNYKGKQNFTVAASDEIIQLQNARQVSFDTFEVESFRSDGVIDYGYLISAYAGGRGADAVVVDENNKLNGQPMQIISSLASRQAVLTSETGEQMTVNYVGYTQSTDGKQEPKFRLPAGKTLQPGVKYSVTSDWFVLSNNTFTAQSTEPLVIGAVDKVNDTTLNVTLTADPGDELFAYRSIQLKGSDGTTLTAQYKVQSRKGAVGVFELQNNGKLQAGVQYDIAPVGNWAIASNVKLSSN
ncbi:S-layer homology domain-containing protein [Paenibacillus catalpae]|uniref:S-layer homology domain-containing protein n=1 Tax=Paenibacillus catalpae TaxID=1045775 RepID=A0A1I1YRT2_9BACL|nr:S-layer homology domain-containing protein [Paenibacillus catalpae]SFE22315.1 S-layer homology domain-containing protein [Paenibacillus catalpae]